MVILKIKEWVQNKFYQFEIIAYKVEERFNYTANFEQYLVGHDKIITMVLRVNDGVLFDIGDRITVVIENIEECWAISSFYDDLINVQISRFNMDNLESPYIEWKTIEICDIKKHDTYFKKIPLKY